MLWLSHSAAAAAENSPHLATQKGKKREYFLGKTEGWKRRRRKIFFFSAVKRMKREKKGKKPQTSSKSEAINFTFFLHLSNCCMCFLFPTHSLAYLLSLSTCVCILMEKILSVYLSRCCMHVLNIFLLFLFAHSFAFLSLFFFISSKIKILFIVCDERNFSLFSKFHRIKRKFTV